MAVQRKGITAEKFARLPNDDTFQELIRGEVHTSPPPMPLHGGAQAWAATRLTTFVQAHGLGAVFVETGFCVGRNPDTVLAPDVAFVRADRLPEIAAARGYPDLVPDLVIEVISPSETRREVDERMREWLRLGARLGWAADPRDRSVAVYPQGAEPRLLEAADTLDGADVLPGFRCSVGDLFP